MTKTEHLLMLWETSHNKLGWLRQLEGELGLSLEDINFLENFDQEQIGIEKELEEEYQNNVMPQVKQHIQGFMAEMSAEKELKQARTDYLNERLSIVKKELSNNYEKYYDSLEKNRPVFLAKAVWELNRSEELIKEIKNITRELDLFRYAGKSKLISQQEIEMVLDRPIKDVIESCGIKVKNNMAFCPFHPEKQPSFYVKGSFAYCFGCGKSLNAIDFLKEFKGLTFPQAIQWLKN